jgi:hypothetical protein
MNNISKEALYNTQKHEDFVKNLKDNLKTDLEKREQQKNELTKMYYNNSHRNNLLKYINSLNNLKDTNKDTLKLDFNVGSGVYYEAEV